MASIAAAGDGWVSGGVIEQRALNEVRVLMAGNRTARGRDMSLLVWPRHSLRRKRRYGRWSIAGGERPLCRYDSSLPHKIRGVLMASIALRRSRNMAGRLGLHPAVTPWQVSQRPRRWVSGGVIEQRALKRSRVSYGRYRTARWSRYELLFGQGIQLRRKRRYGRWSNCRRRAAPWCRYDSSLPHKIRVFLWQVSHCAVVGIWLADLASPGGHAMASIAAAGDGG